MTLTVTDVFVAVVLFSCVPLQYFILQNWGNSSESSRSYALKRFMTYGTQFYDEYLNPNSWKQWLIQVFNLPKISIPFESDDDDHGESPAIEVMKFKQNNGYFAMSPDPRTHRSPNIEFRVGQVIVHKTWKYRGVIIGWDEKARAPPEWIEEFNRKNKMWKNMPNYSILVDTRDRLTPQITYVPQENLEVVKSTKVFHPLIDHYFENYDGAQYIPRPWLQTLYPQD